MPHSLLTKMMADGVMPNMAKITAAGNLRRMEVTVPEIGAKIRAYPSWMWAWCNAAFTWSR